MIDYLQKFRLDNKTAFVMGGLGLIGREVSIAFSSMGAKTIILDIKNQKSSHTDLEKKISDFDLLAVLGDPSDSSRFNPAI